MKRKGLVIVLYRAVYTVRAYVAAKRAAVRVMGLRRGLATRVHITWRDGS